MTDIVERLREPIDPDDPNLWKVDRDRLEAADEIERLRGLRNGMDRICLWMSKHGYATGHAEQIEDLMNEIDWQAKEIGAREALSALRPQMEKA
jgi:gamma-glutamyl:cysteine ligase YbdK (ATP-grasp superfamily)